MKKFIKEIWPYAVLLLAVILIKSYVISPIRVNGPSMENTLLDQDIMLLDKISYRFQKIKRFDIVVVHLDNEELYVNGKYVKEEFSHAKTKDFNIKELGNKKVPKDKYFVVGDNRVDSLDSRILGFISKDRIQGHAFFTILPFSRWGSKS